MNPERDDSLLDCCLDEVLGGHAPPDLSADILRALELGHAPTTYPHLMPPDYEYPSEHPSVPASGGVSVSPATPPQSNGRRRGKREAAAGPLAASITAATTAAMATSASGTGVTRRVRRLQRTELRSLFWGSTGAAAAMLIAAVGFLIGRSIHSNYADRGGKVASRSKGDSPATGAGKTSQPDDVKTISNPERIKLPTFADGQGQSGVRGGAAATGRRSDDPPPPAGHDPEWRRSIFSELAQQPAAAKGRDKPRRKPSPDAEVIAVVNDRIQTRWKEAGVQPSPPATDAEWCRRTFVRLLGRIPSVAELRRFTADKGQDKRRRLVDLLMDSQSYREEFVRNWASIWTNVLVGRGGGMRPGSMVDRTGLQQYLRQSLLDNKPYDDMVYELVSATGSNRPGTEDFNGAVNFLLGYLEDDATAATAKTAQVFLGVQVQCTQCHNHPFDDARQGHFWELNAFFRQTHAERVAGGDGESFVRLVNRDFAGEGANPAPQDAEIYFDTRDGELRAAYPKFLDGTQIGHSGFVSDVDRRRELARLISSSDYASRAVVNRVWEHMFGHAFTRRVDDISPHSPPSHPELLQRLGEEFAAGDYDLKQLIRWMALSEPFELSSRLAAGADAGRDDPRGEAGPLFSRYYMRQMRPEEVYESLLVAANYDRGRFGYDEHERIKSDWLQQFTIDLETDECDEASTFDGSVSQTLMMMNGRLMRQATDGKGGGFLQRLAADRKMDGGNRLEHLYLAALARRPTAKEIRLANEMLRHRGGDESAALEDIWWALLNSSEFIMDH